MIRLIDMVPDTVVQPHPPPVTGVVRSVIMIHIMIAAIPQIMNRIHQRHVIQIQAVRHHVAVGFRDVEHQRGLQLRDVTPVHRVDGVDIQNRRGGIRILPVYGINNYLPAGANICVLPVYGVVNNKPETCVRIHTIDGAVNHLP